jgi:glycosyltransferase involved in cell wall biosynthesis
VIAISEQTRKDIIRFYGIPEEKIKVCYQSCNPRFGETASAEEKNRIREKYDLPPQYFLYVGSLIRRKNLLGICKALLAVKNGINIPLVVIGDGTKYKEQVKQFIKENNLEAQVIFLSETAQARNSKEFRTAEDFPAIYQQAIAMIYPSFFEGFGIPVLEALWSRLPVITSNVSSLPEAAGPGAYYVDPGQPGEIASGMKKIISDTAYRDFIVEKGFEYAQNFSTEKTAAAVMNVYKSVW